ncbi:MAG: DUF192 domain-containing protein [Acidobacteria bacterium]|nr:DUF192 domain-containing protein [Acidobacteriota bacterium]
MCLAENLILANTSLKRLRGLLGRASLPANEGLWLRPCNSIHTIWMRFAIDVIFLDRQLRIVRLVENIRPFRLTRPNWQAASVIEMAAHSISRLELRVGDELRVEKENSP